mgnify:CR=1 FL=1
MPLFVDFTGMNTLVSQDLDLETNTLSPTNRDSAFTAQNLSFSVQFPSGSANNGTFLNNSTIMSGYPTSGGFTAQFWLNMDNDDFGADNREQKVIFRTSPQANVNLQALSATILYNQIRLEIQGAFGAHRYDWNLPPSEDVVGKWNHFVISWSGLFHVDPILFLNAVPQYVARNSDPTRTGAATWYAPQRLSVGAYFTPSPGGELQGKLAHLAFWDIVTKQDAVTALYNGGTPISYPVPNSSDILDYWLLGGESSLSGVSITNTIASGSVIVPVSGTSNTNLTSSGNIIKQAGVGYVASSFYSFDQFVGVLSEENQLAGLNLHRNGPYGFSSWNQLRASRNPLSRHHRETNKLTFVTQPGEVRNVLSSGELRVRDRYSTLYNFTEPAVCQKSYPLVWNVGRHFKDEDGNVSLRNLNKFSIISSYGNQQIAFANEQVNKLLGFEPDEEQTEYATIKDMYLDNGLNKQDSPLTYWEFLQYRETVFPKEQQQFIDQVRNRPQFQSFYRHDRSLRNRNVSSTNTFFGFNDSSSYGAKISTWPLDASTNFLTETKGIIAPQDATGSLRRGTGILQNHASDFVFDLSDYNVNLGSTDVLTISAWSKELDANAAPLPSYTRRISFTGSSLALSNPSGIEIYGTSSGIIAFEGHALWEAGTKRQIKDADGNYVSSPKYPFYDSYDNYVEEVRKYGRNYAIIPEFRMSNQVEDYMQTDNAIELDMFEVSGGVSGSENSSKNNFYEIYSNTDFMKNFEIIANDHDEFTNGKVLSMRCKVIKKFLPYEGFYPCQRTVDLAKRFYDSYKDNIKLQNSAGSEISDFNFGRQIIMDPLFSPGVLFNTIKSGVAVDYPIITGSLNVDSSQNIILNTEFDARIPFEALVEPKRYLSNFDLTSNEPHPSGNLSASAAWDGHGDEFYSMMANNFLAAVPEFFLPKGQLSSIVSKKQKRIGSFKVGELYGMRVKMRRSMDKTRVSVYHSGQGNNPYFPPQDIILTGSSAVRETFTMYSRPSAFGPPSAGKNNWQHGSATQDRVFHFDQARFNTTSTTVSEEVFDKDSTNGHNFPFTPPYYHGEGWCEMWMTASKETMTIEEIQNSITSSFNRFDSSFYGSAITGSNSTSPSSSIGPQSILKLNKNAVQLSASLNLFGVGTISRPNSKAGAGNLVVDTGEQEDNRWIIQTKFETPMLNFNHISGSDHLSLPTNASESVPRGMWHQYGRIPEENEGVFLEIGPIPENYQKVVGLGGVKRNLINGFFEDLSDHLGFSGIGTKLGRLASSKKISEAVVAVPFVLDKGRKKFFKLDPEKVRLFKEENFEALTTGLPNSQVGRSVLMQMDKMRKFVFPPSFDFLNFDDVDPVAMYIFEFSHTLTQQDLSDIWQNLPPDIGTEMEVAEVAITHPLLRKELLGQGGKSGNATIEMPDKLKWMVFKVKQRAASNYFKRTVLRNAEVNTDVESGNVTRDEFGDTGAIQYNWPYDFFSLVEMVKLDAEVEMGNIDFSNYTDIIPDWNAVVADSDKIVETLQAMEEDPIPNPSSVYPALIEEGSEIEDFSSEVEAIITGREIAESAGTILAEESQAFGAAQIDIAENIVEQAIAENTNMVQGEIYVGGVNIGAGGDIRGLMGSSGMLESGIPMEDEFIDVESMIDDVLNLGDIAEEAAQSFINPSQMVGSALRGAVNPNVGQGAASVQPVDTNLSQFAAQYNQAQQAGASATELTSIAQSYGINASTINDSEVQNQLSNLNVNVSSVSSLFTSATRFRF